MKKEEGAPQNMSLARESFDKLLVDQGISLVPRPKGTKVVSAGFPLKEAFRGKVATLKDISVWPDIDRAAVCGINGLVVLDFDSEESYRKFWDQKLASSLQDETFTIRTSRGYANWFFDRAVNLSQFPSTINARPTLQLEIFLKNHLAACPGNTHPSGAIYRLLGTGNILRKDGIVRESLERLKGSFNWKEYKILDKKTLLDAIRRGVDKGQRNEIAWRYSVFLLQKVKLDFDTVWFEICRWNKENRPPLSEQELQAVVSSAVNRILSEPQHTKEAYPL